MINLSTILSDSNANVKLEITSEDLKKFSDELISKTLKEFSNIMRIEESAKLLTKEEVKKILGVCDATLWHWSKNNYLKPVKIGSKTRYHQLDVNRILDKKNYTSYENTK